MDKNAKRTITAAVMVALVILSLFGTVGLTATKTAALSLGCSWDAAPLTGKVGDLLFFKLYQEFTQSLPLNQQGDLVTVKKPDGSTEPVAIHWDSAGARRIYGAGYAYPYVASFYYKFETAGDYTVSAPYCGYKVVNISGATPPQVGDDTTTGHMDSITKLELDGATAGTAGESYTYTVKAFDCDSAGGNCKASANPVNVFFRVLPYDNSSIPVKEYTATTKDAVARMSVPFSVAGKYVVIAGSEHSWSNDKRVTINAKPGGNGGGLSGVEDALSDIPNTLANIPNTLANIPNTLANIPNTLANIPNALSNIPFFSSGSEDSNSPGGSTGSSSGGWMWIFALGAILLIAAILAFVWWSRRERYEEEDEGYADDEYRRLEERRR